MIRQFIFLIGLVFCFCVPLCFAEEGGSAETFIKKMYLLDHKPAVKKGIDFEKRASLMNYFDNDLTNLFIKDAECERREQGVCNLDFDPIYAAQDFEEQLANLKIEQLAGQPNAFRVTFTNLGTRSLVYRLSKIKSGWRISDIEYQKGPTLKQLLLGEHR